MKKTYVSPSIQTEQVEIGVFGCSYGGNGGGNHGWGDHTNGHPHGHNTGGRGHWFDHGGRHHGVGPF